MDQSVNRSTRYNRRAFLCAQVLLLAGLIWVTGCQRKGPLVAGSQPRTPYTQYRVLHGREVPEQRTTSFGETYPNLRGRLLNEGY